MDDDDRDARCQLGKASIICNNVVFVLEKHGATILYAIHDIPVKVCAASLYNHGFK